MPFFAHFCSINPFPLRIKQFLRRPESLLLIGMLIGPFIYRETMIDIQLHDTYYVFGEGRLVGNHFYWFWTKDFVDAPPALKHSYGMQEFSNFSQKPSPSLSCSS